MIKHRLDARHNMFDQTGHVLQSILNILEVIHSRQDDVVFVVTSCNGTCPHLMT